MHVTSTPLFDEAENAVECRTTLTDVSAVKRNEERQSSALGGEPPPRDVAGQRGRAGGRRPAGGRAVRRSRLPGSGARRRNALPGRAGRGAGRRRAAGPGLPDHAGRGSAAQGGRVAPGAVRRRLLAVATLGDRGARAAAAGGPGGRLLGDGRPADLAGDRPRRPDAGRGPAAPEVLSCRPDDRGRSRRAHRGPAGQRAPLPESARGRRGARGAPGTGGPRPSEPAVRDPAVDDVHHHGSRRLRSSAGRPGPGSSGCGGSRIT